MPLTPSPLVLGSSRLGERPGAAALADAMVRSPLGDIDTSNNYAGGQSERLLGEATQLAGGHLSGKAIYSKADRHPETGQFDGDRVRRSLEESLNRLGLDHLPLYHLHDPFTVSFKDAMASDGAVPALVRLRDEGVVGAIGIATGPLEQLREYVSTDIFDAVLSHNRFTLVDRSAAPVFEAARERGMTIFNAAPFGGGTLANGNPSYGYQEMPAAFAEHIGRVRGLAHDHGVNLAAAALRFSLDNPLVDATVVGTPSVARLEALTGLVDTEVSQEFFVAVEELGAPPSSAND